MRSNDSICKKIESLEAQFRKASDWLLNTGSGVEDESTLCNVIIKMCPYFFELEEVMKDRPSSSALFTNKSNYDSNLSSSGDEDGEDDADEEKLEEESNTEANENRLMEESDSFDDSTDIGTNTSVVASNSITTSSRKEEIVVAHSKDPITHTQNIIDARRNCVTAAYA